MSASTLQPVALEPPDLRAAFRQAAASTWVVTGHSPAGPVGFTAISITSVSVDPPLVTFNIGRTSSSLPVLTASRRAALHLLSGEQAALATRFARDRSLRFVEDGTWAMAEDGLPEIHGVVTRLVTRIVDLVDVGDNHLAIARVEAATVIDRPPLVPPLRQLPPPHPPEWSLTHDHLERPLLCLLGP